MYIIFRCYNCESLNDLLFSIKYRFCKHCGKIITYSPGEAIFDENNFEYNEFRQLKSLDTSTAEKFFNYAEQDVKKIEQIIETNTPKKALMIDLPNGSLIDNITFLLKNSESQTLDDLVWNCQMLDISIDKLEKILIKMKNEGLIYLPTSWSLKLV